MKKNIFHIIQKSFELRSYIPKNKEMKEFMQEIEKLEFDGPDKGRENLRNDIYRWGRDFRKSIVQAKEEFENKELCIQ